MRVLIADDEEDIRFLCRINLEADGIEVAEAGSGAELFEAARREVPDVILLDITMPGGSGWECLEEIRADPVLAHVPVIMLSARVEEDRGEAVERGADGYLAKPFRTRALVDAVRSASREPRA